MDSATLNNIRQGYCPLCMADGKRTKVKTFQINFEEALFMCSLEGCFWPLSATEDELIFINRPIHGPEDDWSSWIWSEEQELEYLKSWKLDYVAIQKIDNKISNFSVSPEKEEAMNFFSDGVIHEYVHEPNEHSSVNTNIKSKLNSKPKQDNTLTSSLSDSQVNLKSSFSKTKSTNLLNKSKVILKSNVHITKPSTKMSNLVPRSLHVKNNIFGKEKKVLRKFSFEDLKHKKQEKMTIKQNNMDVIEIENSDKNIKDSLKELPVLEDYDIHNLDFEQFIDTSAVNVKTEGYNANSYENKVTIGINKVNKKQNSLDSLHRHSSKDFGIELDAIKGDELNLGDKSSKEISKYLSRELNGSFDLSQEDFELIL